MDILLFNPYYSQSIEYYSFFQPASPIGLMYLAAYLRKNNLRCGIHELGVFNINESIKIGSRVRFGLSDEAIAKIIEDETPKIIGITNMYSIYYRDVMEIAQTVKMIDPTIKVVVGGNHASSYWNHILKNQFIDFVVLGEGEEAFLELCTKLLNGKEAENTPGIAYRDGKDVPKKTLERPLIPNLDDIPFPAYDMVDFRRYFGEGNPFAMRFPAAGIVSSRGCPGDCVYCTVKAVWGRTWRGRTAKNVVDEMEFLKKNYSIREFAFLDDSASVDRRRWEGICDEITARALDIKWSTPNGIAHWTLTKDILDKMKKSGCYRITFGIESGNLETRKFLGKPYSLLQAEELIRHANRIGMWTICTNIIGFPYEKLKSIKDTVDFAKKSGTDFACFYLLIPQPTSEVYSYFKKEGLLDFDSFFESDKFEIRKFEEINYVLNETGTDTVYFKKERLNRLQKEAYRSFILYRAMTYLFNPLKILMKIHSVEDAHYISKLLGKGFEIFFRTLNPMHKKSSDYLYKSTKKSLNN
jgi:magnesium-protoporphyrin IX monomethyl ester (oxidative) cyclase